MFRYILLFFPILIWSQEPSRMRYYLALGDSYTIGESVPITGRFPALLVDALNRSGHSYHPPEIIARTGWTTDELAEAMKQKLSAERNYDLVSLLIGVNNQYRGRDPNQYRQEFQALLRESIRLAGNNKKRVFVLSIPDWGVTPFGKNSKKPDIAAQIDLFNKINKEETTKEKVLYVDITGISRKASKDLTLVAPDGLHPAEKMYQLWVDKILKMLKKNLLTQ
jgi:lysophospholipase L1-like esterase